MLIHLIARIRVICDEERQYVPPRGQGWTTLQALSQSHFNSYREYEPGVIGIGSQPAFAIGQRAILVRTEGGNVLWDCVATLDAATVTVIEPDTVRDHRSATTRAKDRRKPNTIQHMPGAGLSWTFQCAILSRYDALSSASVAAMRRREFMTLAGSAAPGIAGCCARAKSGHVVLETRFSILRESTLTALVPSA